MRAGNKVVCYDDSKPANADRDFTQWIVKDQEYTIRATSMDLSGNTGILLEEVRNKPIYFESLGGHAEPRFNIKRFREITDLVLAEGEELVETLYL